MKSIKDVFWGAFITCYYFQVKLAHSVVYAWYTSILYFLFILVCITPSPNGEFQPFQVGGLACIFVLIVLGFTNLLFARISSTRTKIDNILGEDFIIYHEIIVPWNHKSRDTKILLFIFGLFCLVYAGSWLDVFVTMDYKMEAVAAECAMRVEEGLPKMSHARFVHIMDTPSVLGTYIKTALKIIMKALHYLIN